MKPGPPGFACVIFLAAFFLRLIPVLLSINLGIGLDDMFQYDMLARSLAAGNGYRWYAQEDLYLLQPYLHLDLSSGEYDPRGILTSFRPPLYPAFLALIYSITGISSLRFFIARLVQAALGAALAPLTYILAKRILRGSFDRDDNQLQKIEKSARLSAWAITLYPMLIIYSLSLATENLFFLLMLSSILVLFRAVDRREAGSDQKIIWQERTRIPRSLIRAGKCAWSSRWFFLTGILLGLTALTRSVALAFSGLIVVWIWFFLKNRKMALAVFLGLTVTILPWMVRNSLVHQRVSGIETALGYQLYVSYHPESSGTFQYPQSLDLMTILDDAERDDIGMDLALGFIQDDPGRFPYLMVRRLGYFFGLERRALTYFYSNNFFGYIPTAGLLAAAAVMTLPFVFLGTSASFGFALLRRKKEIWFLALLFAGYILPHLVIIAEDRFHLALLPFIAVLAAGGWVSGRQAWLEQMRTRAGKIALVLASILVILLFLNWGLELWRDADKLIQLFGPDGNQTGFSY